MFEQLDGGLKVAAGIGSLALVVWDIRRRRQNLDPSHVPGQQVVDRLREEVKNLKAEQGRQRWYDLWLAIVVAVVALGHIISPH